MALIMIYDNNGYLFYFISIVLCCVFYYLMGNYVRIDYLSCQPKTLSPISSKPAFEDTSFNIWLIIGIP